MSPAPIRQLWILTVALAGCASIAGFEDLSSDCPPSEPSCRESDGGTAGTNGDGGASGSAASGGAVGATGSAGSGASGNGGMAGSDGGSSGGNAGAGGSAGADAASCGSSPPPSVSPRHGPDMALIRRADRCYWIDVTEVTEGQYAEYLAANPTPRTDALCSATPDV